MPVKAARRHGGTPSISVSTEKLRKVLPSELIQPLHHAELGAPDARGVQNSTKLHPSTGL
jgi:hypothetical protein